MNWKPRPPLAVDVVLSGGAGNMPCLSEALDVAKRVVRPRRLGGTSAGGLKALFEAFRVPADEQIAVQRELLSNNKLLDASVIALANGSLCRWRVIGETTDRVLGRGARLGDAAIPVFVVVSDLYQRKPLVVSSWEHPDVLVREVASATSAIWPVAAFQTIPSLGTGNRKFFDGGFAKNFAMDVFDDDPTTPTLGITLGVPPGGVFRPARTRIAEALGVLETMLYSSDHGWLSSKNCSRAIVIPSDFDGFDFNQSESQFDARRLLGRLCAEAFDWSTDLRCLV